MIGVFKLRISLCSTFSVFVFQVFSGSSFAETGMFHLLSRPFVARYVRFKPLSWIGKICMRVEVFGCPYNCDRPFGISYRAIPDKAVTASSSLENHPPSSGRLNRGTFNKGSWCAKTLDQQQYLQVCHCDHM